MMEWERAFVAAGGLLGAGSDPWGTGFLPGLGNLRNYELLLEAGFDPERAVQIVTLNGARILGEDERLGSIAPGKLADLVVIRGKPDRDAQRHLQRRNRVQGRRRLRPRKRLREAGRGKVGSQ